MELVVCHNLTGSQDIRNLSPFASRSTIDHKDSELKIWKAFYSHMAMRLFPGTFRNTQNRHCERLLNFKEWSVDETKYRGYMEETIIHEALNFSDDVI